MTPSTNETGRPSAPELDRILGQTIKVLDDGFIRVIDYLGNDAAIVQAARVSYGEGTKTVRQDSALIRYLMRHRHTSPFEMCELKLHIRVPMDCWRQWIRHRTANVNEYSTRYSIAIDAAARTEPGAWRLQSSIARQGSERTMPVDIGQALTSKETALHNFARQVYEERLTAGVAREQARKDLPLSTYTEAFWKCDLHNLLHFLSLRMDPDAQTEIREYANVIGNEIVSRWCPMVWSAFLDYRANAMTLSAREVEIVRLVSRADAEGALAKAKEFGWLDETGAAVPGGEIREAEAKLRRLELPTPQWMATASEKS